MSLIVQKYGGSSVADVERIRHVAGRVGTTRRQDHRVVVVVSAMGKTTDSLIRLAQQITARPSEREMDMLLATGEQVSVALLAMALHELGLPAISMTGQQAGILTDDAHMRARIHSIATDRMLAELDRGKVVIVAGFQGETDGHDITTLGRGGSDTTAVALAAALDADLCEIYTDVDGVYTADPRVVPNARKLASICHDEMLELASLGAKVLQSRSVEFAKKFSVPLVVRSTFTQDEGTYIIEETDAMEEVVVRGASVDKNQAKLTVTGVPDRPGIAASLFRSIADRSVNVDMIVQNVSEHGKADISFTVAEDDLARALDVTREAAAKLGAADVNAQRSIAKLSVVGIGMRTHSGVAARMFAALADAAVNIQMISTSEIKISCIIDVEQADHALRLVHDAFDMGRVPAAPDGSGG